MKLNKKIKVVIPAGGNGLRFQESRWKEFKPFIKILDKTIFEWILIGFKSEKYDVSFDIIIQNKFKEEYQTDIDYLKKKYKVEFYYINILTEGTTPTALFLYDKLDNNDFLLLANCDQIIDINFDEFLDEHFKSKSDASVLVFENPDKDHKWSYVAINQDNSVLEVKAKSPISSLAISGWYSFTKSKDFLRAGIKQIINQDKVNGEYYLCPSLNYLIQEKLKVKAIVIKGNKMHGIGTPEDLEIYLKDK